MSEKLARRLLARRLLARFAALMVGGALATVPTAGPAAAAVAVGALHDFPGSISLGSGPVLSCPAGRPMATVTCWMVGDAGTGTDFTTEEAVPVTDGAIGQPVPLPSTDTAVYIGCPTTTACVALGSMGKVHAFIWLTAGKVTKTVPVPQARYWSGLACPSAALCVAVGTSADGHGLVATWDGKLAQHVVAQASAFDAVSCSAPTACVAVGQAGGTAPGQSHGVFVRLAAGAVSTVHTVPGTLGLGSVACDWTALSCEAGGEQAAKDGGFVPSRTVISGAGVSTVPVALTAGNGPVICPAAGKCLQFGVMEPNRRGEHGFVTTINGGQPSGTRAIAGTADVYWLSCPGPGHCVGLAALVNGAEGDFSVATFTFNYSG